MSGVRCGLCGWYEAGKCYVVRINLGLQHSHGVGVADTSGVTLDTDNGVASRKDSKINSVLDTELESVLNVLDPVLLALLSIHEWIHASVQVAVSGRVRVSGDHDDRTVWSVLGAKSSGGSGGGEHNDSLGVLVKHRGGSSNGNGLWSRAWLGGEVSQLGERGVVWKSFLGDQTRVVHHGNGFQWVVTLCCLPRQHDTVSTVQNGVTNVRNLGSCWSWVVSHRLQHLGGTDNRLSSKVALGNHLFLHHKHLRSRNLDTQISSSNHNSVGLRENLVKVVHTLLVLDLGDDLDVLTFLAQDLSNLQNVVGRTDERSKHHVDLILDTESQVVLVLLGQSRQVHVGVWQVHTLVGTDLTGVDGNNLQSGVINNLQNLKRQNTIVNINNLTGLDDLGDVLVVDEHQLVITGVLVLDVCGENHLVVRTNWPVLVVHSTSGSDFRSLGVQSNSKRSTWIKLLGLSGIINHRLVVFVGTVREVHSHNVESGLSKLNKNLCIVGLWTNGTDNRGPSISFNRS
ncbi:hypothetical protein OGAPHI_004011 [Ogataea philodendri]|uniref:Uncharacterized protein n=1 Tax=Ogataea philodendri TaxID=1378263 RepID=A0A9P8T4D3_9ASCO|nr:uncharacterized protein OGAPHI_004011 [Ogataea philodendri]KAH3665823.1 hypothetical protein OGAPHI_004011 [Ogataea philodendri]